MEVTLQQAFDLFLYDREVFCEAKTLEYYRKNLTFFLDFIALRYGDNVYLSDVDSKIMADYIRYLRNKPKFVNHPFAAQSSEKLKNNTVRTYCRAVKAFLNWCNAEYDCSFSVAVKMPRNDSEEKVPLYDYEVAEIDSLFNLKTAVGVRNYCVFHLMLDAGLRAEEVEGLRVCDVFVDKSIIKIVDSKGNKSRIVLLAPKLKKYLYTYLTLFRDSRSGNADKQPVFTQFRGSGYLNYNCIKQMFQRIKKKTGIDRLTPHLLRHTFATSYIMGGGNLENLRLLLGHYDYTVTRMYLHLANTYKMMGASIYRLDPIFFQSAY